MASMGPTIGRPRLERKAVITILKTAAEARALPRGSIVGDSHGGLTFCDAVANALESRSLGGWQEVEVAPGGDRWTVIFVDR